MEEMKEKLNIAVGEDTEEKKKWRGLSQGEMDQTWKNVPERMEEEVLDKCKVEESKKEAFRGRGCSSATEQGAQKQEIHNKKLGRRLLGKNFLLV